MSELFLLLSATLGVGPRDGVHPHVRAAESIVQPRHARVRAPLGGRKWRLSRINGRATLRPTLTHVV